MFNATKNYMQILRKVGWSSFFIIVALLIEIRYNISPIDSFLTKWEGNIQISFYNNFFEPFTLLIAIAIAIFSRAIILHDRLSDFLKIRENFDMKYILTPFCVHLNLPLTEQQRKILRDNRALLMRKTFYAYASSIEGENKIDRHEIIMALDQWSWFWICEEAIFYLIISIVIHVVFMYWVLGAIYFLIILFLISYMKYSFKKSIANAENQIELILNNPTRKKEVKKNINAVLS